MASQNIARLGVVLGLETAEFSTDVNEAIAKTKTLKNAVEREAKAATKEINLIRQAVQDYGREVSNAEKMQRQFAEGGKYENLGRQRKDIQEAMIKEARLLDERIAKEKQLYQAGSKAFQMNVQQRAALAYQTTDILTGLASGQNPLIVMIQQGGQLRDQFGGFGNLFRGIAQSLSITRVAVVGLGSALGGLAYLAYQGNKEFKEFRNNIALTGGAAGLTFDSFRNLSAEIGNKFNVSVSDAKDIISELAKTGRFTAEQMGPLAGVIANVSRLSGESADIVARNLIPSFDGSASSAKKLNEQYNFLTFAQYKQIEALEKAGQKSEAARITAELLNKSLDEQKKKLEISEGWWSKLTRTVSNFVDTIKQIGAPETSLDALNRISEVLGKLNSLPNLSPKQKQIFDLYMQQYREYAEKYEKEIAESAKKADDAAKIRGDISKYDAAGGKTKQLAIEESIAKARADLRFQIDVENADKFTRIDLEARKKADEAFNEYHKNNIAENYVFAEKRREEYELKLAAIEQEREQRRAEISRQKYEEFANEQRTRRDSLETEEKKLMFFAESIFMSEKEQKIALNRLKLEQQIARIRANKELSLDRQNELIAEEIALQNRADAFAELEERLIHLKAVNQLVFRNMEQAIEQFVRTGKLSFKDLARSIIQGLLEIELKAQFMYLFNSAKSSGGGLLNSVGSFIFKSILGLASGGPVQANTPYLVGEKGPELFVPTGSNGGTIVPNHKLRTGGGGETYITNNYINAIDTKSFEDRLMGSSTAIWAANQYANKSLAVGRGRT
jgi:phage-related minor tail protein